MFLIATHPQQEKHFFLDKKFWNELIWLEKNKESPHFDMSIRNTLIF